MSAKRVSSEGQSSQFSDALLFAIAVMIVDLVPSILIVVYFGTVSFILFFVAASLGVMLGFALYVLRANSFRQKELLGLLKSQHGEFFHQIRSNVVRLLEKGAANERFLPRSP